MHGNLKALRYWVSLLLAHTLTVTAHQLTFSKQHIAMTWLHRSMPCPTSCQVWQLESRKIPFQDRKISEDVPKKSTLDPYTGWKIRKWSPPYTNTFCCLSCLIRDPCCMELGQSHICTGNSIQTSQKVIQLEVDTTITNKKWLKICHPYTSPFAPENSALL